MKLIDRLDELFGAKDLAYSWGLEITEAYPRLREVARAAVTLRREMARQAGEEFYHVEPELAQLDDALQALDTKGTDETDRAAE